MRVLEKGHLFLFYEMIFCLTIIKKHPPDGASDLALIVLMAYGVWRNQTKKWSWSQRTI